MSDDINKENDECKKYTYANTKCKDFCRKQKIKE